MTPTLQLKSQPELPFAHAAPRRPDGVPADVCDLFERLALQVAAQGFKRYSARALLHRIRWHFHVEKGDRDFKCNNNSTPAMARWFLAAHPELPGFFETRSSPNEEED
jgi:hypothetical protein